jgi:cytochrome c5
VTEAAIGNDGKEWPETFDGMAWAIEFNKLFPSVPVDDALGWFCNAIMRGYDSYAQKHTNTADTALADADAAMTEARQDEIEHAEGERIFDRVCQALQLDPNHGDCDSGDHADFIVSAVERHIERLKLSALADADAGGDE